MALEPPESHHLSAAIGWLELGNSVEAAAELNRISPGNRNHPEVLEVKWSVCAKEKQWELCAEAARELTKVEPKSAFGWVHLSFALHEQKLTQQAYDNLKAVVKRFPEDWLISYNMACYACQLGNLEQSRQLLSDAMTKGGKKEIESIAKTDPDLVALFEAKEE